jgi:hypothetical protein
MIRKLLIAIPCYDSCRPEFVASLTTLEKRLNNDGIPFDVGIISGTLVYMARDALARHAVNNDYTHVLWLDCDMVFGDSILEDLMMCGKDMVCGRFISRHNPYLPTIFSSLTPEVKRITEIPEETFRIYACGFACVLMTVEILRTVMINNNGKCFLPTAKLSEDLAFCQRVNGQGFEIWREPTARVGHIGPVTIWPEDGERYRGEILGLDGKKLE